MAKFGDVAEWSIAADCKSVLNSTVVRIHPSPPRSRLLDVTEAFDYTLEIRWQKTVSVRMETTLTDSDRQNPNCTQTQNKMDGQSNRSIKGLCGNK